MDTTPSTIMVTTITLGSNPDRGTATLVGVDEQGVKWTFRLDYGYRSGAYYFLSTALDKIAREGTVYVTSHYDSNADKWVCVLGNYGIPSHHFYEWQEV